MPPLTLVQTPAMAATLPSYCTWCTWPDARPVLVENVGERLCAACRKAVSATNVVNIRLP